MTEEKFIEQIKGIDLSLWKRQMVTVMEMQEDWRLDDSDQTWKKAKAEEVDGLVEVLGIICDFIEPIKRKRMKYIVIDTWNGPGMEANNGVSLEIFDTSVEAEAYALKNARVEIEYTRESSIEESNYNHPDTTLAYKCLYEIDDDCGTYQVHMLKNDIYAVKILCNVNEIKLLTKEEYYKDVEFLEAEVSKVGGDVWETSNYKFMDDGEYYYKFVLLDGSRRVANVRKIIEARKDWTLEDYKEAYGDLWDYIPHSVGRCQSEMRDYIYNTYDDALIDEILNDELN